MSDSERSLLARYCGNCMRAFRVEHPRSRFNRARVDRPAKCEFCGSAGTRFYLLVGEDRPDLSCDFCTAPQVIAFWEITPFEMFEGVNFKTNESLTYVDDGIWGACPDCDALIAARDKETLLRRALRAFQIDANQTARVARITELHLRFWEGTPHGRKQIREEVDAQGN